MKPLFYLLRKSLKNYFKELRKKPAALIGYIVMALFVILMVAVTFIMPSSLVKRGSAEVFGAIVTVVVATFVYFSIKQGIDKGSSFFRLSDVNLVFTAPISPKKVLIYGFIQQLMMTFFIMLFVSFQIPNLRNNFPITKIGVLIIYVGIFLLFFIMQLLGMLIYSITSKSKVIRANVERVFNITIGLFFIGFLLVIFQTKDLMKAAVIYLNNQWIGYIPFVGWFKMILISAVYGIGPSFYLNMILILFCIALMIFMIYKQKTDYYEDVLGATELNEQRRRDKKEGRVNAGFVGKVRKVQFKYTRTGARAIFQRHMLEYKKTGFFFINKFSLITIGFGLASKYFFKDSGIKTILYLTVYMQFFFSIQGKWVQELGKPFIYLLPEGSARKVFFATLADNIKNCVDGFLLFIAAGFMFKVDIITIILCALSYMSIGAVYIYGDVLSRKLFGEAHSKNLEVFIKMFLVLFLLAPGIVVSSVISYMFANTALGEYVSYLILIGYNIIVSVIILFMSKGIFENLEMR
ncbi:MAG TPA: putative ABC exporter domain-containing protein [Clostridia bacterium]